MRLLAWTSGRSMTASTRVIRSPGRARSLLAYIDARTVPAGHLSVVTSATAAVRSWSSLTSTWCGVISTWRAVFGSVMTSLGSLGGQSPFAVVGRRLPCPVLGGVKRAPGGIDHCTQPISAFGLCISLPFAASPRR